jgi:hypothetical protein
MNDGARLYDEFFDWLDNRVAPIKIPSLFPELEGFEMSASDFLAEVKRGVYTGDGYDHYCDVLFEIWFKNKQEGKL